MNRLFANLPTTVFEVMSSLARETGAINLGQGFPDEDGPIDIRRVAADALLTESNQYPPMLGTMALRQAVAAHYKRFQGLDIDHEEVLVTSGATEAIAATLLALIEPGDEVLLFQPMYDAYRPLVERAGGVARFARLDPPGWRLTHDAVVRALTPRTRFLILNNPLNPAARAFDRAELEMIAALCIEHRLVAICDEVWEHVLFDRRTHIPLIALPGMRERTIKIGSAGKIFSLTGWKVGFVVAAPALVAPIARAHQFLTFTTPPALQTAVAYGLGKDEDHFDAMRAAYQQSRDRLATALTAGGYTVLPSEGTYFLTIDLRASGIDEPDHLFCRRLVEHHKVAAIPLSAFYAEDPVDHLVRLCFAKHDATLDEAARRLIAGRRD